MTISKLNKQELGTLAKRLLKKVDKLKWLLQREKELREIDKQDRALFAKKVTELEQKKTPKSFLDWLLFRLKK